MPWVRLITPTEAVQPLHEFLPRHEETVLAITNLKLKLRLASSLEEIDTLLKEIHTRQSTLAQIERLAETNPMLDGAGNVTGRQRVTTICRNYRKV